MVKTLLLLLTVLSLGATPLPRSRAVIREFAKSTGYPNGRPGYVVDHKVPLCAGGPDKLENLQWQEVQLSYKKDGFERDLCRDMQQLKLRMQPVPNPGTNLPNLT